LFIVGQEVAHTRHLSQATGRAATDQQAAKAALGGLWSGNPAAAQRFAEQMAEREAAEGSGFAGEPGSVVALNPPLQRRITRLRAMGAEVKSDGPPRSGPVVLEMARQQVCARGYLTGGLAMVALAVLVPLAFALMLVAMALMALFTLACGAIMMAVVYGLLQLLRP
jgi:hypothetical protein